jgi:hypothetical protein
MFSSFGYERDILETRKSKKKKREKAVGVVIPSHEKVKGFPLSRIHST